MPVLGSVLMGTMTSCEDFLTVEPQDKPVIETYYTSADRIRMSCAALYSQWEWKNYSQDFQWKFDMLAGDMYYTYSEEGQFYFGNFSANNAYLKQGWDGLYNIIAIANTIINDMPAAARGNGVPEADIEQGLAEARCMRGVCYFLLSQYWGDVPIITNGSAMVGSGNFQVPRNTRGSVYKFVEKDLEYAAGLLKESDAAGRPTRWTALAYLSKLHLTMASHADRADRSELYRKAASEANEVIRTAPTSRPSTTRLCSTRKATTAPSRCWQSSAWSTATVMAMAATALSRVCRWPTRPGATERDPLFRCSRAMPATTCVPNGCSWPPATITPISSVPKAAIPTRYSTKTVATRPTRCSHT